MFDTGTLISNQLSRGEFSEFSQAVKALKSALQYEQSTDDEKANPFWQKEIDRCDRALRIYDEIISEATAKAVEQLRSEDLNEFASSLETGYYSNLAY